MAIWFPRGIEERDALMAWAKRLPVSIRAEYAYPVAVVRGAEVAAVCIYHEWRGCNIEMSIVAETPRWATKQTVRFLLSYPFIQYDVRRVSALIERRNKRSRKLVEGLGFRLEGVLRDAFPRGDGMIYGFTRKDWEASRWYAPVAERKAA